MKIVTTRRISQIFFFGLFIFFCVASTVGTEWWQIRDWPVNWILQLDPLVGLMSLLTTHKLYWPLLWGAGTVVLTIIFGRFFCSWVCPFGSMHHFLGWIGRRKKKVPKQIELNKYRKAQNIKYFILAVFIGLAIFPSATATLQAGLLDPIPLVTRSINLTLLPLADSSTNTIFVNDRYYEGAWLVFTIFISALLLNFVIPRFYCRFVCPLGAFFGIINRFAIWRIGKNKEECLNCGICEKNCEGGCEPMGEIKWNECVLCFNCLDDCKHGMIAYQPEKSAGGEQAYPDVSRRGFVWSIAAGAVAAPVIRLAGTAESNWYHKIIRPPGALPEEEFLKRCIKCGQCMRVCPTNVIQPASVAGGIENLWTPVLNNRIGTSGCQLNCTACSQICPTAALRPITLEEKLGVGEFEDKGPIKLGTAFFDRNRCLPWAMNKPCIVCQENCPVSPKAIYTKEVFNTVRNGNHKVVKVDGTILSLDGNLPENEYAGGDYYCFIEDKKFKILQNARNSIKIQNEQDNEISIEGRDIKIKVKLQRPYIDLERCIGCGVCEHECPVTGKKAVRVSGEGESRSSERSLLL